VLDVTALGPTLEQARQREYAAAELISWPGRYLRTDIGSRPTRTLENT
jgi:phosphoribosylamine--glycine ligase